MTYLTIAEQETRAYMAGNVQLANALAQCDDYATQVNQLELELDDAKDNSLAAWERDNGPAYEYVRFFNECFDRLGEYYPCPSVTSDHDKSVIFNTIEKGETTE